MKFFLLLLNVICFTAFGQNFEPFNQNVPKRFQNQQNITDNDYFFFADSIKMQGDSTIFYQYHRVSDNLVIIDPNDCPSWGGFDGPVGDTTWLSRKFIYNQNLKLLLIQNQVGDELTFDFNLNLGDSALFYQTLSDEYYIKLTQEAQETILGQTDSVKTFTVLHYDNSAQVVASNLHLVEIKIAENLGLVSFIDCNNFPQNEIGVELMGQLHPTLGKYQMTYDEAYPWQIGDAVEYVGNYQYPSYSVNNKRYQYFQVTNRVETVDSVKIYFDIVNSYVEYPPGNGQGAPYIGLSNPFVFAKGENIIEYPSNKMPTNHKPSFTDSVNTCGMREHLVSHENWTYYCDSCDCLVYYDGFATTLFNQEWKAGLGKTYASQVIYGGAGSVPSQGAILIYSNIDGNECGQIVYIGNINYERTDINIYPNPASDYFQITGIDNITAIKVMGYNGQVFIDDRNYTVLSKIDISLLARGVYLLEIETSNGIYNTKIIKD